MLYDRNRVELFLVCFPFIILLGGTFANEVDKILSKNCWGQEGSLEDSCPRGGMGALCACLPWGNMPSVTENMGLLTQVGPFVDSRYTWTGHVARKGHGVRAPCPLPSYVSGSGVSRIHKGAHLRGETHISFNTGHVSSRETGIKGAHAPDDKGKTCLHDPCEVPLSLH